ncbi:MAG: hypothetical protein NTZ49_00925 [Candidatus Parcubacteria bacterium]|nr:hypothetical protein [Candidatus Parcubacteria bacterium]
MSRYFVLFSLLALIFLSACGLKPNDRIIIAPNTNDNVANVIPAPVEPVLREIDNPNFTLPEDINAGQIQKFFRLNEDYYALVMRSSMNVLLNVPADFKPQFVGLLKVEAGNTSWSKYLEIVDKIASAKNNPYHLWLDDGQLYLSIVDQNGAGSGEGVMKVFKLKGEKFISLGCYYYPGSESSLYYFSNTQNIEKFTVQKSDSCNNLDIIMY